METFAFGNPYHCWSVMGCSLLLLPVLSRWEGRPYFSKKGPDATGMATTSWPNGAVQKSPTQHKAKAQSLEGLKGFKSGGTTTFPAQAAGSKEAQERVGGRVCIIARVCALSLLASLCVPSFLSGSFLSFDLRPLSYRPCSSF